MNVSIRRADLGLSERSPTERRYLPMSVSIRRADLGLSEPRWGRSIGERHDSFNPPGGFGAFGTERYRDGSIQILAVSIRRADLGLSERARVECEAINDDVSIRRADLGLSEHTWRATIA